MKNVKLIKAKSGKGWFLTIGEKPVSYTWVVTSVELWCLGKMIKDNAKEIMEELED